MGTGTAGAAAGVAVVPPLATATGAATFTSEPVVDGLDGGAPPSATVSGAATLMSGEVLDPAVEPLPLVAEPDVAEPDVAEPLVPVVPAVLLEPVVLLEPTTTGAVAFTSVPVGGAEVPVAPRDKTVTGTLTATSGPVVGAPPGDPAVLDPAAVEVPVPDTGAPTDDGPVQRACAPANDDGRLDASVSAKRAPPNAAANVGANRRMIANISRFSFASFSSSS